MWQAVQVEGTGMGEHPRWFVAAFIAAQFLLPLAMLVASLVTGERYPGGWTMFSGI